MKKTIITLKDFLTLDKKCYKPYNSVVRYVSYDDLVKEKNKRQKDRLTILPLV
jgi:hypothetical protein